MKYKPAIVTAFFKDHGFPEPTYEYMHIAGRRFKLDIAWQEMKIGIEVQGGVYQYSPSHASAKGIIRDMEKNNLGLVSAWRVLKVLPADLCTKDTVDMVCALWETTPYKEGENDHDETA